MPILKNNTTTTTTINMFIILNPFLYFLKGIRIIYQTEYNILGRTDNFLKGLNNKTIFEISEVT